MNKLEKIALGISIVVIGFFVIVIGWGFYAYWTEPKGYEERQKELDAEQAFEKLKQVQKEMDQKLAQAVKEETKINEFTVRESLKNYETPKENFESTVPESCKGVNSMEIDLYPTGKQCLEALDNRVVEWCQSNGSEGLVEDCRTQFYLKLADTCKDPVIGSVEVCLMHTLKELYPRIVP